MTTGLDVSLPDTQEFQLVYVRSFILIRIASRQCSDEPAASPTELLSARGMQRSHHPQDETVRSV